jgi:hypothetical protein
MGSAVGVGGIGWKLVGIAIQGRYILEIQIEGDVNIIGYVGVVGT